MLGSQGVATHQLTDADRQYVDQQSAMMENLFWNLSDQEKEVARLERLGARTIDIGQRGVTWVVMADPEGNEFCVLRGRPHG